MIQPLTTEAGLNTPVLTHRPPTHRKLLRLMLRPVEPTGAELRQAMATGPTGATKSASHAAPQVAQTTQAEPSTSEPPPPRAGDDPTST